MELRQFFSLLWWLNCGPVINREPPVPDARDFHCKLQGNSVFLSATMSVLQVVCISHRCSRPYYLTQRIEVGVDKML